MRKTLNENLPLILKGWKGNPLDDKGRYKNLYTQSEKSYRDLFKWQLGKNQFKPHKKNQKTNVSVKYDSDFLTDQKDGFTWLGHASFLYTLNKIKIIVDPVFGKVGPLHRLTKLPCDVTDIKNIDLILLSHNHRDHLDKKSMVQLCKQNPKALVYAPLGLTNILKKWKIGNKVFEAGWYQQFGAINGVKITFLPSKHWNRRGLLDLNEMLWGSFMIQNDDTTLYFAGDSGIDDHFTQIAGLFPIIDYSFIGIGAYEPNWFMQPSHTNPVEALECHKMLKSKQMFPMHYGTFDLSDEPIHFPKIELQTLVKGGNNEGVKFGMIGEKVCL